MKRTHDKLADEQQATLNGCSSNLDENVQKESIIWNIINGLHHYLCLFVRFIMVKLYGKRGQSMPPVNDRLLLESATSIAEKIRTKQVRICNKIDILKR